MIERLLLLFNHLNISGPRCKHAKNNLSKSISIIIQGQSPVKRQLKAWKKVFSLVELHLRMAIPSLHINKIMRKVHIIEQCLTLVFLVFLLLIFKGLLISH